MEGVVNIPTKDCQNLNVTNANNVILQLVGDLSGVADDDNFWEACPCLKNSHLNA